VKNDGTENTVSTSPAVLVDEVARERCKDEFANTRAAEYNRSSQRSMSTKVETDDDDCRKTHHSKSNTYVSTTYTDIYTTTWNVTVHHLDNHLTHVPPLLLLLSPFERKEAKVIWQSCTK